MRTDQYIYAAVLVRSTNHCKRLAIHLYGCCKLQLSRHTYLPTPAPVMASYVRKSDHAQIQYKFKPGLERSQSTYSEPPWRLQRPQSKQVLRLHSSKATQNPHISSENGSSEKGLYEKKSMSVSVLKANPNMRACSSRLYQEVSILHVDKVVKLLQGCRC